MKYKHKKTGRVVTLSLNPQLGYYYAENGDKVPSWVVEDGEGWDKLDAVIFTTDDGVDIYDKDQELYCYNEQSGTTGNTRYIGTHVAQSGAPRYGWKYFSTKEARLSYMASKKPVLTVEDILLEVMKWHGKMDGSTMKQRLMERITIKLKNNDSNL